ncbi:MAG: DUF1330 domain-containing protein [SAR86 cluster bacterium]|uniref:DUF1330 domain-containing protein n=1 Tax=SAR86 cluster bacterium TaxID=2030880 RepID=A0A368BK19_9GAMM|nr:MAG: DUF1330 domain-containing protein [SAR86 cluster bacterium]|tara:strand:- start:5628 stop:6035 length:408 start_codon:yes stop_codon:yes gene_type:complete
MIVLNSLRLTDEQMKMFMEFPDDKPIKMVNLLKFKNKAEYKDKRETALTGEEAYNIYSEEVGNHLAKVGGKIIFWGKVKGLLLGEVEELWDQVAIAEYPNKTAMITMFTNEDYLVSEKHRSAGLEGQLNIITQDE